MSTKRNPSEDEIVWTLKKFKIKDLVEFSKNPRQLTALQYSELKKSIDKFGLIDKPIVNLDGLIIAGHQRKRVLEKNRIKEVECWVPSRELDEKEVEELNIRHNKNTGDWDEEILANEWDAHDLLSWGFSLEDLDISLEEVLEETDSLQEMEEEKKYCTECGQEINK